MIAIKDWVAARERCGHMMHWLTVEPVTNPLVQLTLASKLALAMLEIAFSEEAPESRKRAVDWTNSLIVAGLRSQQMSYQVLKLTDHLGRSSQKRQLAMKLSAMCGNRRAAREHRKNLEDKVSLLNSTL